MDRSELKKQIGKNIEQIMKNMNMIPSDFAKHINVDITQLRNVIKGERSFSLFKLCEISGITKYSIQYIVTGKEVCFEDEVKEKLRLAGEYLRDVNNRLGK